jgi:hypothetical protein
LAESDYFRAGLAQSVGLDKSADFPAIVDEFLTRAGKFLDDVEQQDRITMVQSGAVALNRFQG